MTNNVTINKSIMNLELNNSIDVVGELKATINDLYENKLSDAQIHKIKNKIRTAIIYKKLSAQLDIDCFLLLIDVSNTKERLYNKGKANGVVNTLLETEIKEISEFKEQSRDEIAVWGRSLSALLDLWQLYGATVYDLFDLCCTEPSLRKEILQDLEKKPMSFSEIVFIHCPDYNHYGGDVYELQNYAPLTHCTKEYHLKLLTSASHIDPVVREKTNAKIFELFPEIKNCIKIQVPDCKPLSEDMRIILKTAVQKVIAHGDETDKKLTTFVNAVLINAYGGKHNEVSEYLSEADDTDIEKWLDRLVPGMITENKIIDIMKSIDFYCN